MNSSLKLFEDAMLKSTGILIAIRNFDITIHEDNLGI
jgi:hypothetical protein